jgi:K+-transporting ATPase ATPase C chain
MKGVAEMKNILRPALAILGILTVVTGVIYPLAVTGVAAAIFPRRAGGSLVEMNGRPVGSELIGQPFSGERYFWGRPSATTPVPYNAEASSGSNMGPANPAFLASVSDRVSALLKANPAAVGPVPADLLTASGSGLDPEISPEAAAWQTSRVASARHMGKARVQELVNENTRGRFLGVLGEPRVNVLKLNLALDSER